MAYNFSTGDQPLVGSLVGSVTGSVTGSVAPLGVAGELAAPGASASVGSADGLATMAHVHPISSSAGSITDNLPVTYQAIYILAQQVFS